MSGSSGIFFLFAFSICCSGRRLPYERGPGRPKIEFRDERGAPLGGIGGGGRGGGAGDPPLCRFVKRLHPAEELLEGDQSGAGGPRGALLRRGAALFRKNCSSPPDRSDPDGSGQAGGDDGSLRGTGPGGRSNRLSLRDSPLRLSR